MSILMTLLRQEVNVNQPSRSGWTPLHCAAYSGWSIHAFALVRVGARLHTGPSCSPLCCISGDRSSVLPIARYLREEMGDQGLTLIEQDHARLWEKPYEELFPRNEKPLLTRPTLDINAYGLCSVCSKLSLDSLLSSNGFQQFTITSDLRDTAPSCRSCGILASILDKTILLNTRPDLHLVIHAFPNGEHMSAYGGPRSKPLQTNKQTKALSYLGVHWSEDCYCDENTPFPSPDFSRCRKGCSWRCSNKLQMSINSTEGADSWKIQALDFIDLGRYDWVRHYNKEELQCEPYARLS